MEFTPLGLRGGEAAEDVAFHGVDGVFDGGDLLVGEAGEVGAFGDEATDEAIVVFIGSSFEGAEGMGVEERTTVVLGVERGALDPSEVPELTAVVARQALHVGEGVVGLSFETAEGPVDTALRPVRDAPDDFHTCGAFSQDE